jgi:hypothetical protein
MEHRARLALDAAAGRRWLALAVGSLVLAGLLSLLLVIGRLPLLHHLFDDPLFFRRCLVVHVNLALGVWFYAFVAALFFALPPRRRRSPLARAGSLVASAGVIVLLATAAVPDAEPVLANYVPVIGHPLYAVGLGAVLAGLVLAIADPRLWPRDTEESGFMAMSPAAQVGIRAAAVALLLAAATFAASALSTPSDLPLASYAELVVWGGGHVLQFASVAAMLAVWTVLIGRASGGVPISRPVAGALFGILVLPLLAAPWLALRGTTEPGAHDAFTWLMRWTIFPVVLVYLVLCVRAVVRARARGVLPRNPLRDARIAAFAVSAAMTLVGFVLGALIRGSSTMIPAHYHASIGAVTAAFMGVSYPLLQAVGIEIPGGRWSRAVRWQPVLFGVGQLVFAIGFGLAGAHGQARKTYADEQVIRSTAEWIGLGVMGLGGVVAVAGGVAFLVIVGRAWLGARAHNEGGSPWRPRSIPSRS